MLQPFQLFRGWQLKSSTGLTPKAEYESFTHSKMYLSQHRGLKIPEFPFNRPCHMQMTDAALYLYNKSHRAQACDTLGSVHAQRRLVVQRWRCSSPHSAGCQTAGWGWIETMSTYRNSGASWTQPAGAPANQKAQMFSVFFCDSSHLFFLS